MSDRIAFYLIGLAVGAWLHGLWGDWRGIVVAGGVTAVLDVACYWRARLLAPRHTETRRP